jgi:hypothetical protein
MEAAIENFYRKTATVVFCSKTSYPPPESGWTSFTVYRQGAPRLLLHGGCAGQAGGQCVPRGGDE